MTKTEIEECKAIIAKYKAHGKIGQRPAGVPLTRIEEENVKLVNKLSELRESLLFVRSEIAKWQGTDVNKVRLLEQRQRDINAEIKGIEADGTTTKSRAA